MSAPQQAASIGPKFAYRISEVAELCSVSEKHVRRALAAGELAAHQRDRIVLIQPEAIKEWLDAMPSWGEAS